MHRNIHSALRVLRRAPGFSVALILAFALGIGANTAVFSALDAVVLRPLPFPQADELVSLRQLNKSDKGVNDGLVASTRLEDWNRLNSSFQAVSGYFTQDSSESSGLLPEKLTQAFVAPRFLQVWGVSPALGRDFTPAEEHFGGPAAVLISDRLWHQRFNADAHVLGKTLRLEGGTYPVVGVLPASFVFPVADVDVWTPTAPDAPFAQSRESTWFTVIGRLKPKVTIGQASADLATVQSQLGKQFPKTDANLFIAAQPLKETMITGVRGSLWLLFASVTLLLLIACSNIAALLLARMTSRQQEFGIRVALGASRAAIVAQLLMEVLTLASAGAALGLLLANTGTHVFARWGDALPGVERISLDWRVAVYTLCCTVAVTLLCGLIPALQSTRRSVTTALASSGRSVSARSPLQWTLVGIQVSLAVVLLISAGLLLRSFQQLARVAPGFDASHVLTFRVSGNWGETANYPHLVARIDRTLEALRALPGVDAAATSAVLPGIASHSESDFKIVDGAQDATKRVLADARFVSAGYFDTLRIALLQGEACKQSDSSPVVIVNRSFAESYFPGTSAIGHHLNVSGANGFVPTSEIRGIVADAREQGLNVAPSPTVYRCISAPDPTPQYLVRTSGDPANMAETIRRKLREIEPSRSVYDIMPLQQHLDGASADDRMRTLLLTMFALTAISLACLGLFGTLSYLGRLRQREVGLRIALGAMPRQITVRFVAQGLRVTAIGCVVGLLLSGMVTRYFASTLYGVSPLDLRTYIGVVCLVVAAAAVASLLPAMRAVRVQPSKVLREE